MWLTVVELNKYVNCSRVEATNHDLDRFSFSASTTLKVGSNPSKFPGYPKLPLPNVRVVQAVLAQVTAIASTPLPYLRTSLKPSHSLKLPECLSRVSYYR